MIEYTPPDSGTIGIEVSINADEPFMIDFDYAYVNGSNKTIDALWQINYLIWDVTGVYYLFSQNYTGDRIGYFSYDDEIVQGLDKNTDDITVDPVTIHMSGTPITLLFGEWGIELHSCGHVHYKGR